jgi:serine protease Do
MKTKSLLITTGFGLIGGMLGFAILAIVFGLFTTQSEKQDKHKLVLDYYNSLGSMPKSDNSEVNEDIHQAFLNISPSLSVDFTEAASATLPAVVHIKTQFNTPNYTLYDFVFGTQPRHSTPVHSTGSGVILSSDGYVVTNNHVIENAEIIEVILNNRRKFQAQLIGRDATTDIALLKVDGENLPHVNYGNSDNVMIGEWVLAIGNPFNLTSTATHGIISAKARNINILTDNMAIESFIQTDAAVNPGNSGGALVNIKGELIGINTAIASRTGSFVGYSFAIPVNIVRKVVADIVEFGEVQRAYLGMDILDIDSKIAAELNVKDIQGVYATRLWENGAARQAGLQDGDIILEVNGFKVNSTSQLLEQISKYRPGDEIDLLVNRNGRNRSFIAVLQNKYGNTDVIVSQLIEELGARFEPISEFDKNRLKISHGIQVSDTYKGRFSANGIRKGFIVMFANKSIINNVKDLEDVIKNSAGSLFIEGVYPNGSRAYYAFNL